MKTQSPKSSVFLSAQALLLLALAPVASAASVTWSGTSDNDWMNTGNWSGSVIAGGTTGTTSAAVAVFNSNPAVDKAPVISVANLNILGITFDTASAGAFTIGTTGGNPLLLSSGGIIQMTNTVVASEVINAPLVIENATTSGTYTIQNSATSAAASLTIGGSITGSATSGTTTLNFNAWGSGSNTISGAISDGVGGGKLGLSKDGAGTLTLSGSNSYSGTTFINNGALIATNSYALGTSAVTVAGATGGPSLELSGGITLTNLISLDGAGLSSGGILQNLSGSNTLTNFRFLGLNGTRIGVANGSTLTITNAVQSVSGNTMALRVLGGGTLELDGDNRSAFAAFNFGLSGAGGLTVKIGNAFALGNGNVIFAANSTLQSASAAAYTVTNPLQFTSTATAVTLGAASTGNLTFTGTVDLSTNLNLTIGNSLTTLGNAISTTNAGTLTINKLGTSGTLALTGITANTYSGLTTVSSGELNLNKTAGVNAIAGNLTVNGGQVSFGASNQIADTSAVTMSGSTSVFNGPNVVTLQETIGSLNVTGGTFNVGTLSTWNVTGATTFTGGGTGNTYFAGSSGSIFNTNSLSLIAMTGTVGLPTGNPGFFLYGNNATQLTLLTVGSGGLSLNGSILNLRRSSNTTGLGSSLLLNGDVSTAGSTSSSIAEDASGVIAGTVSVALGGTNTAAVTRTFNVAGGGADLTVGVPITSGSSSSAALTKTGVGTLILSASNSYNGVTTVNNGAVNIQNANALGTTAGSTSVASGAALQIQGGITVGAEALSLAGSGVSNDGALRNISGNNTYGGIVTLTGNTRINSDAGTLTLNSGTVTGSGYGLTIGGAGNTTISSSIGTGAGTLTKDGAGTLILSASNSYSGATAINNGVVNIQNANALGTTAGSTSVASGAALQIQGGITVGTAALSLSGSGVSNDGALRNISGNNTYGGAITLTGNTRINSDFGVLTLNNSTVTGSGYGLTVGGAGFTTIGSSIGTGAGTLTKDGTGTVTLTGSNSYSGATISQGVANIRNSNALGSTTGTSSVASGAALQIQGGITVNEATLSLSGSGIANDGALRNISDANTYGGAITLTGNTRINSDGGTLTLNNGTVTGSGYGLTVGGAGNTTISSSIGTGGGTLTKDGGGTLTLSGSNSYGGATFISNGVLVLANSNALGYSSVTTGSASAQTGLQLMGDITVANLITLGGGGINNTGILQNISGSNTLNNFAFGPSAGNRISVANGSTLTITGGITTTQLAALRILGGGTLELDGDNTGAMHGVNTFLGLTGTGGLTIKLGSSLGLSDSFLDFEANTNIQSKDANSYTLNNLLSFSSYASAVTFGAASTGDLTFSGSSTLSTNLALTIANSQTTMGAISGTGSLNKLGAGTLTLSGSNSYTGATTVSAGKLAVNGSTVTNSAFTVASGGMLGGSGTVGGTVLVQSGGHLAPGNSISSTFATGALTLAAGSLSDFELGTASTSHALANTATKNDRTNVNGALVMAGTLNLINNANAGGLGSAGGGSYLIFTQTGTPTGSFDAINNVTGYHAKVDASTSGKVYVDNYQIAAPNTITTPVHLGIVHANEPFTTSALTITNTATSNGYAEVLNATQGAVTGSVVFGGTNISNLAGGATSSSITVGLGASATAGLKNGTATVGFVSNGTNSGYGNTALADQTVTVDGQVNEYAQPTYTKTSGVGTLTGGGTSYTFNLGSFYQNSGTFTGLLSLNNVLVNAVYQDLLSGTFTLSGDTDKLILSGLDDPNNIAIGGNQSLSIALNTALQANGNYIGHILLDPMSVNDNTPESLSQIDLTLEFQVVPEPSTWMMLAGGLGMLLFLQQARRRTA